MLATFVVTIHRAMGIKFAGDEQFTWQVKLDLPNDNCGGAIVATGWAVTATHCLVESHVQHPNEIKVIAGVRNVSGVSGDGATAMSFAPGYVPGQGRTPGQNDVALVRFGMPAKGASVIEIATGLQALPNEMYVAGWSCAGNSNPLVRLLLETVSDCGIRLGYTDVHAWDEAACKKNIGDRFICAGGSSTSYLPGFDHTDSGGGLTTSEQQVAQLLGIANYISNPWEAFARAELYIPWMKACICTSPQTANEPICRMPVQQTSCAVQSQ